MKVRKYDLRDKLNMTLNTSIRLPNALEAESNTIASILNNDGLFELIHANIRHYHFYSPTFSKLFRLMTKLHREKKAVNLVAVCELVLSGIPIEEQQAYNITPYELTKLSSSAWKSVNVETVCGLIKDAYNRRKIMEMANGILYRSQLPFSDTNRITQYVLSRVAALQVCSEEGKQEDLLDVQTNIMDRILNPTNSILGTSTGINALDDLSDGLEAGDYIAICARSGVGKTSLLLSIASHLIFDEGRPVVFCSYEMNQRQIIERLVVNIRCEIPKRVGKQSFEEFEIKQVQTTMDTFRKSGLFHFIDAKGKDLNYIKAKCKALTKDSNPVIMIDYFQKIPFLPEYKNDKLMGYEMNSTFIKDMALEMELPILVPAQLKKPDGKFSSRPTVHQIKGTSAMENDCTKIWLIDRPEQRGQEQFEAGGSTYGKAIIYQDKGRYTGEGEVLIDYDKNCTLFHDKQEFAKAKENDSNYTPF